MNFLVTQSIHKKKLPDITELISQPRLDKRSLFIGPFLSWKKCKFPLPIRYACRLDFLTPLLVSISIFFRISSALQISSCQFKLQNHKKRSVREYLPPISFQEL